jgi:hypothetical protein
MTDRELMQLALDGLNDSEASDARYEAIQALRKRLEQVETFKCPIKLEGCKENCGSYGCGN